MRIGLFTDTYFPFTNGITYVVDITRRELESLGHEVYVFAPETSLKRSLLGKDKKLIRLTAIKGLLYDDQLTSIFFPPRQVGKIEKLNLDVIMIFTPGQIGSMGAYAADRLNIPMVIQYGTDFLAYIKEYPVALPAAMALLIAAPVTVGFSIGETARVLKSALRNQQAGLTWSQSFLQKALLALHERAALVIAVSDKINHQLAAWPGKQQIATLPTGVNRLPIDLGFQKRFIKKHMLEPKDEIILYAGRLAPEKNLDLLLNAFELLAQKRQRAKLLLVGDYTYREELERQASGLASNKRIVFAGRLPRKQLGSVYPLAKAFAFPSLTDTQALVLNEAAHAARPLVWCDTPLLNPVLVNGQTGWQAKNSAKDLALNLEKLLANPSQAQKMGLNARRIARQLSEAKQAKKLEKLLQNTVRTANA